EPAPERLPGAPAPRKALFALDDPRRLSVHIGTLAVPGRPDGERLEREARLDAGPAPRGVALQARKRAVGRLTGGHRGYRRMRMRALLAFPNPVNETSARFVAGVVAVLAVLTVAFQQGWLLPVLAYGFVARALTGPTLSPLAL